MEKHPVDIPVNELTFIPPNSDFEASFKSYISELGDEERYPYPLDLDATDFKAYITKLHNYSQGKQLPDWLVPNTCFWLIYQDEIIAISHLRHCLNEALKKAGGHIGLGVRPSFRNKGISKILLNLTLKEAAKKGIKQAHIHCYSNNKASMAMIQSAGAQLNSRVNNAYSDHDKHYDLLRFVKDL